MWSIVQWCINSNHSIYAFWGLFVKPDNSFWFLWTLWIISIVFMSALNVSYIIKWPEELTITAVSVFLISMMIFMDVRIFGFQFIAYYFLFYSIGYFCHKYSRKTLKDSKSIDIALFLVWLILASSWNMHELPSFIPNLPLVPKSLVQYIYRFTTAFIAAYLILRVAPIYLNRTSLFNKVIAEFGKISLGVYVIHLIIIIPMSTFLAGNIHNLFYLILTSFGISTIVSIAIVKTMQRSRVVSRLFLGKV